MTARPPGLLVERAVGWRSGILASADPVALSFADVPLAQWAAFSQPDRGGHPGGGCAPDVDDARAAAIAEGLERHAARLCPLPETGPAEGALLLESFTLFDDEQRARPDFPFASDYRSPQPLTPAFRLVDNQAVGVPVALVTLDPGRSTVATSSGLAAGRSPIVALLRAVQELVERDAFMTTWLHGLAPPQVELPDDLLAPVTERGGSLVGFDLTPAYSPHPVAAVAGALPARGRPRLSMGLACRSRWSDAVEKAFREWCQGVVYAGVVLEQRPDLVLGPRDVTDFDRHAAYYTLRPDAWEALPLWNGARRQAPRDASAVGSASQELAHLARSLSNAGVDVYYREVTTVDVAQVGLRVVRALAPRLIPINADHNWPCLGGSARDVSFRYPDAQPQGPFPSPAPHPLG